MRRRSIVVAGVGLLAAGGAGWWRLRHPSATAAERSGASGTTASVVRTDLVAREQIPGTLGSTESWQLVHPGPAGVLTGVAAPGSVVQGGQMVYEVDGVPVILLHGTRPVWREFAAGMSPGEDVRQLEENLAGLGFGGSTVDDRFTAATETAIRAWQRGQGRPVTGRLPLGALVFAPTDARVIETLFPLGSRVDVGPVLRMASISRGVTAALPLARIGQVKVGGAVEVALPGGPRVAGTITSIGAPTDSEGAASITIPMSVALKDPAAVGDVDHLPVQVSIVVVERKSVLAVPVTALSAAPAGGYQVTVLDGETTRVVPVRVGLVDERAGLVEVDAPALVEGMRVEVPAQ